MAAALLVSTLSSGSAQLGLANSLVYHLGSGKSYPCRPILVVSLAVIVLFCLPLSAVVIRYVYPENLPSEQLVLISLSVAAAVFGYVSVASQVNSDLKTFNIARTALPLLLVVSLLVLWLGGISISVEEVLLLQVAITGAISIWVGYSLYSQFPKLRGSKKEFICSIKSILGYAGKHHCTVILGLAVVNVDKIFLLQKGGALEFGLYALAFSMTRALSSVQDAVATSIFSSFAGKSEDKISSAVAVGFRLTFLPMLGAAGVLAVFSPIIIPFIFGEEFKPMVIPFSILAFEAVVAAGGWSLAQRFNAGGRPGAVLFRQGITVVPLLLLLPYLPVKDVGSYLAGLMLVAALIRLGLTMAMYPLLLKEKIPAIIPSLKELQERLEAVGKRKQVSVNN